MEEWSLTWTKVDSKRPNDPDAYKGTGALERKKARRRVQRAKGLGDEITARTRYGIFITSKIRDGSAPRFSLSRATQHIL